MSLFENCKDTLTIGSLGLARAIYEYQRLGYTVSLPLVDAQEYDLIIEKDGLLYTVQCKATSQKARRRDNSCYSRYYLGLRSIKTNTKVTTTKKKGRFDMLFVLCDNNDCYSIPHGELPETGATLGVKYLRFRIGS